MNAVIPAVVLGTAFLALAIWIELRERRTAPHDGEYAGPAPRRAPKVFR
jgi:hypothetical protein